MPRVPDITVETITPAAARKHLEANTENYRSVRQSVVARYASDMADGNWTLTGAPVVFNGDGRLIDGQHRFLACVLAETKFRTVVIRNADADAELALDTGIKRTAGDMFKKAGYHDANNVAALARLAWQYDTGTGVYKGDSPTLTQLWAYVDQHPDVIEWVAPGKRVRNATGIRQSSVSLALYLTGRLGGEQTQETLAFVDQLCNPVQIPSDSPVLVLLKWSRRLTSSTHKPGTAYQAAIVLKALNAWRQGLTVGQLAWKPGGTTQEKFPAPWNE